jgi:hypothetical protein
MRLEVPRAGNAEARREGAANRIWWRQLKQLSAVEYTISEEFHS